MLQHGDNMSTEAAVHSCFISQRVISFQLKNNQTFACSKRRTCTSLENMCANLSGHDSVI